MTNETYIPYIDRLTNAQRKKLKKGMDKMRKRFRNRDKFINRLIRALKTATKIIANKETK